MTAAGHLCGCTCGRGTSGRRAACERVRPSCCTYMSTNADCVMPCVRKASVYQDRMSLNVENVSELLILDVEASACLLSPAHPTCTWSGE